MQKHSDNEVMVVVEEDNVDEVAQRPSGFSH
jgi:hypothetical protein